MEMRSFTVDPHNSKVAYCGGNYMAELATLKQRGFIYKTTDGGATWRLLIEPGALVRWIVIDPTDTNVVYQLLNTSDTTANAINNARTSSAPRRCGACASRPLCSTTAAPSRRATPSTRPASSGSARS